MGKVKRVRYTTGELNRAGWLRRQFLERPDITLEQIQVAYDKTNLPKEGRPKDMQVVYFTKTTLMNRYGWKSMDDIPRKTNGKLNMAGLVRAYFAAHPGAKDEEIQKFFAQDMLEVSPAIIHYVRYKGSKPTESPDENQKAGPRAGAETRHRKQKQHRRTKEERLAVLEDKRATYEEIERVCETLMDKAAHLGKNVLFRKLRDARRAASAVILECIG